MTTFTSRVALAALVLLPLGAGCGIADFNVTQEVPPQRIEGNPLGGLLPGSFFQMPINVEIESKIRAQETGPIDSVRLSSLELDVTGPAEADWRFVDEVKIKVSSTKQGSTLPANVLVATATEPGATKTMKFDPVEDVNLKPYVEEGAQLVGEARGTAPTTDVTFEGEAVFRVSPL